MRVAVKKTNVYKFNELTNEVKEKAVSNLYDINVDYEWYTSLYDDAEYIGAKIEGFNLDRGQSIEFSLVLSFEDICRNILDSHGDTCKTYEIAKEYLMKYDNTVYQLSDKKDTERVKEGNEEEFDNICEELSDEFRNELASEYFNMLNREYEYLTSEEAIIETIEANDYEFTDEGEIF